MDLKSYTLEELKNHVEPALSDKDGIVPVSPLRLISYLNNPRAEKSDHVLFEIRVDGKLVAYRTLLPDLYINQTNSARRFAWLSGNYVKPEFRRQGLSTRLLQSAEALWDGKLMYTNYAPASKAVYDRTGQFPMMAHRPGKRFYLRSASGELLGKRLRGRPGSQKLLKTGDQLLNRLRERKLQSFKPVDHSLCKIERIAHLGPELTPVIEQSQASSLFCRDAEVFAWILDFPWVTDQRAGPLDYEFSYRANRFENILLKFTLRDSRGSGLLWLVLHNQKLSAPYLFFDNPDLQPLMATTLVHTMITRNCAYATIRQPLLVENLMKQRKWFLSVRNMPQNLYAHKKIAHEIPADLTLQDGDGDMVFS